MWQSPRKKNRFVSPLGWPRAATNASPVCCCAQLVFRGFLYIKKRRKTSLLPDIIYDNSKTGFFSRNTGFFSKPFFFGLNPVSTIWHHSFKIYYMIALSSQRAMTSYVLSDMISKCLIIISLLIMISYAQPFLRWKKWLEFLWYYIHIWFHKIYLRWQPDKLWYHVLAAFLAFLAALFQAICYDTPYDITVFFVISSLISLS